MAWSRVAANALSSAAVSSGQTVNLGANSTAGSTIIVTQQIGDVTTTATITDSQSNTYTAHSGNPMRAGSSVSLYVWYLQNAPAGITSITTTLSASLGNQVHIGEFIPSPAIAAPFDRQGSATGTIQNAQNSGATQTLTTPSDELMFGVTASGSSTPVFVVGSGQASTPSSYTLHATLTSRTQSEYILATAASGAVNANSTTTTAIDYCCAFLAFQSSVASTLPPGLGPVVEMTASSQSAIAAMMR